MGTSVYYIHGTKASENYRGDYFLQHVYNGPGGNLTCRTIDIHYGTDLIIAHLDTLGITLESGS